MVIKVRQQGIIGDPGLFGRDGDPGIEVKYSPDSPGELQEFLYSFVISVPLRLIKDLKASGAKSGKVD